MRPAAVLVIAFNRPDLLSMCLACIPKDGRNVYIAIDGPRSIEEERITAKSAEVALDFKNNHPYMKISIRQGVKNAGCKKGVQSAIDWIFQSESEAIILEDDIFASESFFEFADWGLLSFKNDLQIWQINGFTPLTDKNCVDGIYLSKYAHIWGWATWRDRWINYDRDLTNFPEIDFVNSDTFQGVDLSSKLVKKFNDSLWHCKNGFDTWDMQWLFSMWINNAFAIAPGRRLTGNLGFDERATHTPSPHVWGHDVMPDRNKSLIPLVFVDSVHSLRLDEIHEMIEFGMIPDSHKTTFFQKLKYSFLSFKSKLMRLSNLALKILEKNKFSKR